MYHFIYHIVLRKKILYLFEDFVGQIWSFNSKRLCSCVNFLSFLRVVSKLSTSIDRQIDPPSGFSKNLSFK